MTPRDFVYWLQGHLEISKTKSLTAKQVAEIRRHIALVMGNRDNRFHQPEENFFQGLPPQTSKHKPKRRGIDISRVTYC